MCKNDKNNKNITISYIIYTKCNITGFNFMGKEIKKMTSKKQQNLKFRQFYCRKCGFVWNEVDITIIKVWCPDCNRIMYKTKTTEVK